MSTLVISDYQRMLINDTSLARAERMPPRVAHLQHDASKLRLALDGADETFVNMLKRALTDVRVPACVEVTFRRNTSAFCDDVLAHRLGMIPMRGGEEKGDDESDTTVKLRAQGPCVVRASAVEGAVHPDLLVVVLGPNEELDADLRVAYAHGKVHARHSAVVAPRVVRRHVTSETPLHTPLHTPLPLECFCAETPWGTPKCTECAGAKRSLAHASTPLRFFLEFETTGVVMPLDLLRCALEHTRAECVSVESTI